MPLDGCRCGDWWQVEFRGDYLGGPSCVRTCSGGALGFAEVRPLGFPSRWMRMLAVTCSRIRCFTGLGEVGRVEGLRSG